jgi:hypothetical protein
MCSILYSQTISHPTYKHILPSDLQHVLLTLESWSTKSQIEAWWLFVVQKRPLDYKSQSMELSDQFSVPIQHSKCRHVGARPIQSRYPITTGLSFAGVE